jgi:hypothetical protein
MLIQMHSRLHTTLLVTLSDNLQEKCRVVVLGAYAYVNSKSDQKLYLPHLTRLKPLLLHSAVINPNTNLFAVCAFLYGTLNDVKLKLHRRLRAQNP